MTPYRFLWGILFLCIAGVLGLYLASRPDDSPIKTEVAASLPTLGSAPSFELTDNQGNNFQSQSLAGKIWIADFFFTSCGDVCPKMTTQMAHLQKRLPEQVHFISITMDPARDTPKVLTAYAQNYGAQFPRWRFLTGERENLQRISIDGFHLGAGEGMDPDQPIIHSTRFVLVDASGSIRGYYDGTEPISVNQLAQDTLHLLEN